MKRRLLIGLLVGLHVGTLTSGCGPSSNINAILFVDDEDETKRFDSLFTKARLQYDEGNFDAALASAQAAHALNPKSERAAQLLGFAYLAMAGIDVIGLVSKLSALGTTSKTTSSTTSSSSSSSTSSLGVLTDLGVLLKLTPDDMLAMGERDDSQNSFYANLPVYLPRVPGEHTNATDPRGIVPTLRYANLAIEVICPYIAAAVMADYTHARYRCERPATEVPMQAQSYLLFSMAHLVETLAFNSVLLYKGEAAASLQLADSGETTSNLLKRADSINGLKVPLSQMGDYAEAVVSIKDMVDRVFDSSPGTMLYETLLDLRMVVNTLKQIAGMPKQVISKLEDALNTIEKAAEKAGNTSGSIDGQSSALKQELNKTIVDKVNTNVGQFLGRIKDQPLTNEQQQNATQMCSAADSLVKNSEFDAPEECDQYR